MFEIKNSNIATFLTEKPQCPYCKSSLVIKHGHTTTGNNRFRCRKCGKTWVLEKNEVIRPDLAEIVEAYLMGRTYRDLVEVYHSSPLRINQKIRDFLDGCPPWEQYVDACVKSHEPRMVYLVGRTFSCYREGQKGNTMYLALAVDSLSTVVLGYEVDTKESSNVWLRLLDRLNSRGVICPTFISNGANAIDEAIMTIFPYSNIKITYHRAYHDKELLCCLGRLPINNKLINEAIKAYDTLRNNNLNKYLMLSNDIKVKDILRAAPELFVKRLKERLENSPRIRIEGMISAFQSRFEKFHMLKGDPLPIINGWIARWMLAKLDIGFSRLSVYKQVPCSTSFKSFSCGNLPTVLKLDIDNPILKSFVIEIAARGLQIPMEPFACEMKLDKCSLI
ncbi:MAG: IS1 family transposase [Bacteroidota bacterium]